MPDFRLSGKPGNQVVAERLDEKLSTRIAESVERRLQVYTAMTGQKIGVVVNQALDALLPTLDELANALTQGESPAKNRAPGQRLTSEETH